MTQARVIYEITALNPVQRPYAGRVGEIVRVNRIRGITYRTLRFRARGPEQKRKADKNGFVYSAFKTHELKIFAVI